MTIRSWLGEILTIGAVLAAPALIIGGPAALDAARYDPVNHQGRTYQVRRTANSTEIRHSGSTYTRISWIDDNNDGVLDRTVTLTAVPFPGRAVARTDAPSEQDQVTAEGVLARLD